MEDERLHRRDKKQMSALFPDTHPKMEALQIELWRAASPTRKMQMLAQLNHSAHLLALAGLRSQYPRAEEAELRRRLAGLLLGEDIACKVYGELPDAK
jgi:predicted component of type VI protein secretion system